MKVAPDSHEIRRLDAVIAELRAENERLRGLIGRILQAVRFQAPWGSQIDAWRRESGIDKEKP